jgi:hypothetical protein
MDDPLELVLEIKRMQWDLEQTRKGLERMRAELLIGQIYATIVVFSFAVILLVVWRRELGKIASGIRDALGKLFFVPVDQFRCWRESRRCRRTERKRRRLLSTLRPLTPKDLEDLRPRGVRVKGQAGQAVAANGSSAAPLSRRLVIIHYDHVEAARLLGLDLAYMEDNVVESFRKIYDPPGVKIGDWFAVANGYRVRMGEQGWVRTPETWWVVYHVPSKRNLVTHLRDRTIAIEIAERLTTLANNGGLTWDFDTDQFHALPMDDRVLFAQLVQVAVQGVPEAKSALLRGACSKRLLASTPEIEIHKK